MFKSIAMMVLNSIAKRIASMDEASIQKLAGNVARKINIPGVRETDERAVIHAALDRIIAIAREIVREA